MTDGGTASSDGPEYRLENARVVGYEWDVKLAFVTEYEFSLVAGHERENAIEDAQELALYGGKKISERELLHTEADPVRNIFEDDVEAGEISWIDEPSAPSDETFWDDSRHFDEQYVDTEAGSDE
ncbi:hypothetical protein [Natronorubrum sp. FCH18a]|uniref:hypothetical protein n=1 Tax=Natronorubrum sp. FCH18a TaxID=3447018 RepID=UPI003F518430